MEGVQKFLNCKVKHNKHFLNLLVMSGLELHMPFRTRSLYVLLSFFMFISGERCRTSQKDCGPLKEGTDLEEFKMRGDVKELSQRYYKAVGSKKDPKKGEQIGPPFYNKELRFDGNGMRTWRRLLDEEKPKEKEKKERTVWKYDEKGKLLSKVHKAKGGEVIWKEKARYDPWGRKVEKVKADGKGKKLQELRIKRGEEGKVQEELLYSSSGDLEQRTHFLRDTSGRIVRKTQYDDEDSELGRFTYERDEKGRPIEIKRYGQDGQLQSWREYEYNDKGHIVKEVHRNSDDSVKKRYEYSYEYDDKCNWTRKVSFVDGEPYRITERELTYSEDP